MRFIKMSLDKNKKEYSIEEVAIEIDKLSTAAKAELASKVKTTVLPFREQSTDRKLHHRFRLRSSDHTNLVAARFGWPDLKRFCSLNDSSSNQHINSKQLAKRKKRG